MTTQPALFDATTTAAHPEPPPQRPGARDLGYIRNAIHAAVSRAEYCRLSHVAVVDAPGGYYGFRFEETSDADAWPVAPGLERELLAYLVDAGMVAFTAADVDRAMGAGR